jgi:putative tricarboxylic transport membrane protein
MALGIGMFGFTQVIDMALDPGAEEIVSKDKLTFRSSILSWQEMKSLLPVVFRSGFLGCVVGIMPGAGATTAAFVSYAAEKRFGRNSAEMGKGAKEGIAAAEAANNGAAAGAFAPLLSLGIPGSGTGAVLLGGLMMWGLKPGPLLFRTNPDSAWGLIASLFIANVITLVIAYLIIPHISKVLCVPRAIMVPAISLVCIVGSYTATYSMYGVWVMLLSGVAGYFLIKNHYPLAPLLLAYVLTRMLEVNMRRTFQISRGSIGIFFEKPLSLAFIIAMVLIVGFPVAKALRRKWRARKEAERG